MTLKNSKSEQKRAFSSLKNIRKLVRDNKLSIGSPLNLNSIIQGENGEVVELLKDKLRGTVKCIYIDPPYNNNETYNHYADTDSHDAWIANTTAHISQLSPLLSESGSIWISIDDWQLHYLKVALDKIFGRNNFVSTIVWEHRKSRENRKVFSNNHEYILVYAKNIERFKKTRNALPYNQEVLRRYKNPDDDPRGPWQSVSVNVQAGHAVKNQFYEIVAPNGRRHSPPKGRCWAYAEERMKIEIATNNVWFGKDGNSVPRTKKFLASAKQSLTPHTIWTAEEVGTTDQAKKELLRLFPRHVVFDTPKPEKLIRRIIEIASNQGDLVLDSYLGSGTTAVAAYALQRKFIGIEIGDQAVTHCAKRLRKLIAIENKNSRNNSTPKEIDGFNFYRLA